MVFYFNMSVGLNHLVPASSLRFFDILSILDLFYGYQGLISRDSHDTIDILN